MKLNIKNVLNILNVPAVEPYAIEKVNEETGELEELHINPIYMGASKYIPYPVYM